VLVSFRHYFSTVLILELFYYIPNKFCKLFANKIYMLRCCHSFGYGASIAEHNLNFDNNEQQQQQ
jgi:hypothetical protein